MNKILVFDDEEAIWMLYELELSEDGYEVICSGEASRCMELIQKHSPSVVVMDKKMGKHDRLEILLKIRSQFPALPLVLCSAYPSHDSEKGEKMADFYAAKSSDLEELKLKVKAAIKLRRVP